MSFTLAGATAIAGGLSALGGVVSGGLSTSAQKKANETNLQIARENNNANRALQREQNEWNLAQWNRENEYNSAASQVQRFREAGLNPYLAMTNGSNAGTASSIQSADYTPASEVGKQLPIDYSQLGNAFGELAGIPLAMAQADNTDAGTAKIKAETAVASKEAEQLGIHNQFLGLNYIASINKMIDESGMNRAQKKYLKAMAARQTMENEMLGDYEVWNARKQEYIQRTRLVSEQAGAYQLDNMIKKKQLPYIVPQIKASISRDLASAAASYAAAGLSRNLAKESLERKARLAFDNNVRKHIPDSEIERLADAYCKEIYGNSQYASARGSKAGDFVDSQIFGNYTSAGAALLNAGTNAYGAYHGGDVYQTYDESYEELHKSKHGYIKSSSRSTSKKRSRK